MAETLSLMEFLQALLTDTELQDTFGDDPQGALAVHGLADLTPDDVHDALVLVQDNLTFDYSRDFSVTAAPPPPPPTGDGHEAAVEYLARYLGGSQEAAADEPWPTLDPEVGAPPVAPTAGVADDSTGMSPDDDYGAGGGAPGAEAGVAEHLAAPVEPVAPGNASADGQDLGGEQDPDLFDDLDPVDAFDPLDDGADSEVPDPGFGADIG